MMSSCRPARQAPHQTLPTRDPTSSMSPASERCACLSSSALPVGPLPSTTASRDSLGTTCPHLKCSTGRGVAVLGWAMMPVPLVARVPAAEEEATPGAKQLHPAWEVAGPGVRAAHQGLGEAEAESPGAEAPPELRPASPPESRPSVRAAAAAAAGGRGPWVGCAGAAASVPSSLACVARTSSSQGSASCCCSCCCCWLAPEPDPVPIPNPALALSPAGEWLLEGATPCMLGSSWATRPLTGASVPLASTTALQLEITCTRTVERVQVFMAAKGHERPSKCTLAS